MKKLLIALIITALSCSSLSAMNNRSLTHANPMPNLMRIAQGNAELLGLNAKQIESLKAWSDANRPKMMQMTQTVMQEEAMLKENALTSDTDIEKQVDSMLQARKNIIMLKTQCRAELKKILTPDQYANVIKIYRSVEPMRRMRKQP